MKHIVCGLWAVLAFGCAGKGESSRPKTDPNAQDIIDVVKHYHRKAHAFEEFTIGFAKTADSDVLDPKKLHEEVLFTYGFLDRVNRKIQVTPGAKTPCGSKVEAAFKEYLRRVLADATQWRRWYDRHKAILSKIMKRKKVNFGKAREICADSKKCTIEPVSLVSYSVINNVLCPSRYFVCTNGFACHFPRIYGAIIGQPTSGYTVQVKSTGRVL